MTSDEKAMARKERIKVFAAKYSDNNIEERESIEKGLENVWREINSYCSSGSASDTSFYGKLVSVYVSGVATLNGLSVWVKVGDVEKANEVFERGFAEDEISERFLKLLDC